MGRDLITCEHVKRYFAHLCEGDAEPEAIEEIDFGAIHRHLARCKRCQDLFGEEMALVEAIRSSVVFSSPEIAPVAVKVAQRRLLLRSLAKWGVVVLGISFASMVLNKQFLLLVQGVIRFSHVIAGAFDFSLIVDFISVLRAITGVAMRLISVAQVGRDILIRSHLTFCYLVAFGVIALVVLFGFTGFVHKRKEAKL